MEAGKRGDPAAILIPVEGQHDPREAAHLVEKLQMAGVDVYRATRAFEADGIRYGAGTFVVPMAQVFARYARDILERRPIPKSGARRMRRPSRPTTSRAWSLGMLMGVEHVVVKSPLPATVAMEKLGAAPTVAGKVEGSGTRFSFDYRGPDAAIAINRLLADGAAVSIDTGARRRTADRTGRRHRRSARLARTSRRRSRIHPQVGRRRPAAALAIKAPRIGMYDTWTGGNMDEGWTRWVLEQYEFRSTRLHNADVRAGGLREKFDAIILPDQSLNSILEGNDGAARSVPSIAAASATRAWRR